MAPEDVPEIQYMRVQEVSVALAGVLEEGGVRLPQLTALAQQRDWRVQLGACNVETATKLLTLLEDGIKYRKTRLLEILHAQP